MAIAATRSPAQDLCRHHHLRACSWQWHEPPYLTLHCHVAAHQVPLFLKTYSAAFGVCAYCGLWANAVAALVMYLNGLEVAPSWDRPWLVGHYINTRPHTHMHEGMPSMDIHVSRC
jgi:hypothetical protein